MHIKSVSVKKIKRFSNLTIEGLGPNVRLVVLAGPNGCGKSSLFDALKLWGATRGIPASFDRTYHGKYGEAPEPSWGDLVHVEFHEPLLQGEQHKYLYMRSAYRNEPDFTIGSLQRMGSPFGGPYIQKMIDNDAVVSNNYQRLVSATVDDVFRGERDEWKVKELRDSYIGELRVSMAHVFDDLLLRGPGDPLSEGTFVFEKGTSLDFPYKNLSGGEKAAFDLLLDLLVKRTAYDNTIYCIDEPDLHMHSKLQGRLLQEMLRMVPNNSQLWVACHSIGMLAKAKELHTENPGMVAFLSFYDHEFDRPVTLKPQQVDRAFWRKTLEVALDDLANLVAPKQVVLCEGKPAGAPGAGKAEFDAKCYRTIFAAEFCDTEFLSIGNQDSVLHDRLDLRRAVTALADGVQILRLVDRDDMSDSEIAALGDPRLRVLRRRHLEAYLLDDEVIARLCDFLGQSQAIPELLQAKRSALDESVRRGNPTDDLKSAAGSICNSLKKTLQLTQCGSNTHFFMRDTLAPLITPDTAVYKELRKDIFGV